jgi:hypothetical protein
MKFPSLSEEQRKGIIATVVLIVIVIVLVLLIPNNPPKPVVTQPAPNTTTIQVPQATITPKVIEKIVQVQDKTEANKLLAENAALKIQVTQLTETIARYQSTGGGIVIHDVLPLEPATPANPNPQPVQVTKFKDWRLDFILQGEQARYTLTQSFEVLSTTGRNKQGIPVTQVKLFEIGPKNERLPITDVKTTAVFADETKAHWIISPTIQAGFGITGGLSGLNKGGIVGLSWLRYGRTKAAEDGVFSALTPVIMISKTTSNLFGIEPIAFNAGHLKHQPFKDVWVGPLVTVGTQPQGGLTLSASF